MAKNTVNQVFPEGIFKNKIRSIQPLFAVKQRIAMQ